MRASVGGKFIGAFIRFYHGSQRDSRHYCYFPGAAQCGRDLGVADDSVILACGRICAVYAVRAKSEQTEAV
ncbi:hypothetical protein D3C75_907080 [compost metagenome]